MKQNKENETSGRRDSNLKTFELEKQLDKANDTIKRLEIEIKNIRKTVANEQIDLKLISEDQAAILAKAEQEKNTLTKQFTEQIADLKSKLVGDNKIWMDRFDIRKKEFEAELDLKNQQADQTLRDTKKRLETETNTLQEQLKKELKQKIDECEEEKRRLILECENKIQQTNAACEREKAISLEEKEKAILDLEKKQTSDIGKLNKSHDLIVASIKSEKRSEQHMHQETKNKMELQKKALDQTIITLTSQLTAARQQIQSLKAENADLKTQLSQQIQQHKLEQQRWEQRLNALQSAHQSHLEQLKTQHDQNATSILQNHFEHIEKLEFTLTVLQTKNQEQKELHSTQIEQIKQIYEERPSREQDIVNMSHIEEKLIRKTKQVEILKNELKWCRLQLDNKEEIYNKIFANEKPIIPSIHRERRIRFANSNNHREVKSNKVIGKGV